MGNKLKVVWEWVKGLSGQVKAGVIAVIGILLLAKYRDLLISILVNSSKRILKGAQSKDADLAAKQNAANQAANTLVDDANKRINQKPDVDENWNKK